MSFLDKLKTQVLGAGEMSQKDIEPGGDFHDARVALEAIMKEAGVKGKVKPFDVYQGPYAEFLDGKGGAIQVWFGEDEDEFFVKKGSETFDVNRDDIVPRLQSMAGKHLKLVKSFTNRIVAKYARK